MIAYLRGKVINKEDHNIILVANDVGYQIFLTELFAHTVKLNHEIELYIYHHVREDAQLLFGFSSLLERRLFLLITSVSGIGPKTGMAFLSKYTPEQLIGYIAKTDLSAISAISGVGKKTAEKLIIEIRDKIIKQFPELQLKSGGAQKSSIFPGQLEEGFRNELSLALESLGYSSKEIARAMEKNTAALAEANSVEDGIRLILKNLS